MNLKKKCSYCDFLSDLLISVKTKRKILGFSCLTLCMKLHLFMTHSDKTQ